MSVTTLDSYFSKLIRCRAEWRCQYSGVPILGVQCHGFYIPEDQRQGLHASHILSRNRRATRWHPKNALSLCAGHHAHMGMNPLKHAELALRILGKDEYENLKSLGADTVKLKKHHLKEIQANLKASWEDMKARRETGETGILQFADPMPEGII